MSNPGEPWENIVETEIHLLDLLYQMGQGGRSEVQIDHVDLGYVVSGGWRGKRYRLGRLRDDGKRFLADLRRQGWITVSPGNGLDRVTLTDAGRRRAQGLAQSGL